MTIDGKTTQMDVKELEKDGLKRRYEVTIAADDLKARRDAKLEELRKTARIPGFRPGKVPLSH
ncbi:MAG TPA: trigger factor family protein, partial [Thermopetrobacter sp.]|nr:trigger factor family protein [Thermopetrobacter sp.]